MSESVLPMFSSRNFIVSGLIRTVITFLKDPPSSANYFPKVTLSNIITLWLGFQYEF